MTINKDEIKKALDSFEEENYVDSREKLKKEIKKKVNNYFKDTLELNGDAIETEEDPEEFEESEEDPEESEE